MRPAACYGTGSPSSRWRSGTWTGGWCRCWPRGPSSAAACEAGHDIPRPELRRDYAAIVLAGGATVPRGLPVPGADLDGIHQAMDFLPLANKAAAQAGGVSAPMTRSSPPGEARGHHRRR